MAIVFLAFHVGLSKVHVLLYKYFGIRCIAIIYIRNHGESRLFFVGEPDRLMVEAIVWLSIYIQNRDYMIIKYF